MGRRWPIGCVALEITQRCNLDCTACYLSEHSEGVKDIPLEELFRRIDLIFEHYGPNANVQVTGGDPTLRNREELVAIVRRLSQKGLRPALFTNGIRAKRELLVELVEAGLVDVAFHVDLTQQRRGYESEVALNEIRQDYIERARGLPLSVMFNTTIFDRNFEEIPAIVRFFVRNCDVVRLASFQLQAETGRGTLGRRNAAITVESVQEQIEKGARSSISFDALRVGHARCNRYGMIFVANNRAYDALDDRRSLEAVLERMPLLSFDRRGRSKVIATFVKGILTSPYLSFKAVGWLIWKAWQARADLWATRGRVSKLSFVIHNFMDTCRLERDRVDACAFMAMTQRGPISMCLHNAKRDAFILAPISLSGPEGDRFWNPISGELMEKSAGMHRPPDPNRKAAKGWRKRAVTAADVTIVG
jgi:MoaA/NifB/PqqE/SkfB family radical SAM enzyme